MSAKVLMPNQCMPLHFLYGRDNCCLCNANYRITELEREVTELKKEKEDATNKEG